jgi:hypothetical protein
MSLALFEHRCSNQCPLYARNICFARCSFCRVLAALICVPRGVCAPIGRCLMTTLRQKRSFVGRMLWYIGVRFRPDHTGRYYHSPRRWWPMACAGTLKRHGNFISWPQRPASRRRGNGWKRCNRMRMPTRVWEDKSIAGRRAACEVALKSRNGPCSLSGRTGGHHGMRDDRRQSTPHALVLSVFDHSRLNLNLAVS